MSEFGSHTPEEATSIQLEAGIQYPLPELDDRFTLAKPFKDDPNANFTFDDETADKIAQLPAWGEETIGWKYQTEGEAHVEKGPSFREGLETRLQNFVDSDSIFKRKIGQGAQWTTEKAYAVAESPRTRKAVFAAGTAGILFGALAGVAGDGNEGKAFAQDHDTDSHDLDHAEPIASGSVHAAEAQASATPQPEQLSFIADTNNDNNEPNDSDETSPYDPTQGGTVLFMPVGMVDADRDNKDHFPDPIVVEPQPDPKADVGFDEDGPVGAASFEPGDDVDVQFPAAQNEGPDTATDVTLRVTIPAGAGFNELAEASEGCELVAPPIDDEAEEVVECALEDLKSGEKTPDLLDVGISVDEDHEGLLRVTAELEADPDVEDPNPDNNEAEAYVNVVKPKATATPRPPQEVEIVRSDHIRPPEALRGEASLRPDRHAMWLPVEGKLPYMGSIESYEGLEPIHAIQVVNPVTGETVCAFTDDGELTEGTAMKALDPSCETHIVRSNTEVIENPWDQYGWYYPEETGTFRLNEQSGGDYTFAFDRSMPEGVGVQLMRGVDQVEGDNRYVRITNERITVVSKDGRLELQHDTTPQEFRRESGVKFDPIDLGEVGDSLRYSFTTDADGKPQVTIFVGVDGEERNAGTFSVSEFQTPGETMTGEDIAVAGVLMPKGTAPLTTEFTWDEKSDMDMTPHVLRNLTNRLKDATFDPASGEHWAEINMSISNGHWDTQTFAAFDADLLDMLQQHADRTDIYTDYPDGWRTVFNQLSKDSEMFMALGQKYGIDVHEGIFTPLDNDQLEAVYGSLTKYDLGRLNERATLEILEDKIRTELARSLIEQETGVTPEISYGGFYLNAPDRNPFGYLEELGGTKDGRNRFAGSYNVQLENVIKMVKTMAAEEFPTLDIDKVRHVAPYIEEPAAGISAFRDTGVTDVMLANYTFPNGNLYRMSASELYEYLSEVAEKIGPSGKIVIPHTGGIKDMRDDLTKETATDYYTRVVTAARAVWEDKGTKFEFSFPLGPGDMEKVQRRHLLKGSSHEDRSKPMGYDGDEVFDAVIDALSGRTAEIAGSSSEPLAEAIEISDDRLQQSIPKQGSIFSAAAD